MNSTKSFIAMALIASLAMQPITAQPVEQTTEQQNKIIKQLKDSYKSLTKHLKCAVKRNCTPEQRKHIRIAALVIIGTLITLYIGKIGKKAWEQRDQGLKVRPDPSFKGKKESYDEFLVRRGRLLKPKAESSLSPYGVFLERLSKLPASSSNPNFAKNIAAAKQAAETGKYERANVFLQIAEGIIRKEQSRKKK